MYLPSHFAETRTEVLHALIGAHPLAALVTLGTAGLEANHIPFELDAAAGAFGTLRGHVARANPVWRDHQADADVLLIFQGPHTYVSPSWYATKKETGKVVPTYNYMVVHAYGRLRVIEDRAWLHALVSRLTDRHESTQAQPWKVSDAPDDYIEQMLKAIVGIEICVTRISGKWKTSQNRPAHDRAGVSAALRASGDANAIAMADAVDGASKPPA